MGQFVISFMEMHNFIFKKWIVIFFLFCAFTCISSKRRTPRRWWMLEDYIMFDNCQDTGVGCRGEVTNCWRADIKRYCKSTCGLCPGQTPVKWIECYDRASFQYCNVDVLRKHKCHRNKKVCKKTCGLCEGDTAHISVDCYDDYIDCHKFVKSCYQPNFQVHCKKTCGLCGGRTPLPSNHCWDEYSKKSCNRHAKNDCFSMGSKCMKTCGLCKGMTPHRSNTCYDSSHVCIPQYKKYCDQKIMQENCKKLCNLC